MPTQLILWEVPLLNIETQCEGWFSISAFKVDKTGEEVSGSRREPVPPFKNLITDAGLNRMGDNADWLNWCQVGSGSTAPSASDTALVSRVNGSSSKLSTAGTVQSSAPFYVSRTITYRFPQGAAAGNLSEVAVGWASSGGLFSRALILDALGSPTAITVLPDELLDVTYQFRQYMPAVDGTQDLTLRAVVHAVVSRACAVTTTSGNTIWFISEQGTSAGTTGVLGATAAFQGPIGSITAEGPGGTNAPPSTLSALAYSSGSLFRDHVVSFSNSDGNLSGGIGAIRVKMGIGVYQFGFTPAIMKTADDILSLTFRHSWSRKTL